MCQLFEKFGINILNRKCRIGHVKYSNPRNDRQDEQGSKAERQQSTCCFASARPPPAWADGMLPPPPHTWNAAASPPDALKAKRHFVGKRDGRETQARAVHVEHTQTFHCPRD